MRRFIQRMLQRPDWDFEALEHLLRLQTEVRRGRGGGVSCSCRVLGSQGLVCRGGNKVLGLAQGAIYY